jgi:putative transposase
MELTQKFSIYPTKEQEDVSWILSEKCRLLYNFALGHRNHIYDTTGASVIYAQQQDDLPEIKRKYPEYEWVHSKVLQMTLHSLDDDFHSFTSKRKKGDKTAQPPGYKGRDYFTTMIWNQSGFKIEDGYIILSHFYNDGKKNYVPLKFKIPEDLMKNTDIDLQTIYDFGKIKQIIFYREEQYIKKDSEYYLSIVYGYPIYPLIDNNLYQAIDLGINKTVCAVNMEGKFFEINNPRKDLYWNPIIDSIQSKRDHCKKTVEKVKGIVDIEVMDKKVRLIKDEKEEKEIERKFTEVSNRWDRLNDIKKKCHKKCSNQINDDLHKWSDKMVKNTKSNTIIVGKLPIKKMAQSGIKIKNKTGDVIKVKSKKINRSIQNQGYISKFVGFLTYKAKKLGKRVIKISEVNTSKRCYVCSKMHDMPLWKRTMECDCGNIIDRDRNSAVNIMLDFLLKYNLSKNLKIFINNLSKEGLLIPIWIMI